MLIAVPLINQLTARTNDGQPSENARADCAAACVLAGAQALGQWLDKTPDWVKDQGYGQGYTGPTDPVRDSALLASAGISLRNVTGDGTALVRTVIAELQRGHPVLGAIPSMWGNDWPGGQAMVAFDRTYPGQGTHEICFCDYDATRGTLTAMNPWPEPPTNNAFYQTQPVAWWAARLVYGRVDVLARASEGATPVPVNPEWDAAHGTLTYPAHDGMPAVALDHGQAFYAHTSGTRTGLYPLHAATMEGSDSVVYWSDGQRSRAVKAAGWAISLEPAGPGLARLLAEHDALAAEDAGRGQQIAALQQRLAAAEQQTAAQIAPLQASLNAANSNVATLTQQVRDLEAQLASSASPSSPASSAPVATVADGAIHSQLAALVAMVTQMDTVVRAIASAVNVATLAAALPDLVAVMDRLDALSTSLQQRIVASGPETVVAAPATHPTDLHSQAA